MSKKTTKRALAMSFVSVLLCVCMLVGTTFAWFTDEAKSAGNVIQTGKLDIVLEKRSQATGYQWVNAENETINFTTADGRAQDKILWEPGCTYVMERIRVINNGDLALKYDISLADATGDKELLNVIDFTYELLDTTQVAESGSFGTIKGHLQPGETSGTILIVAHMDEDAGNEYQNKKLENISVVVSAQQYAHEQDSFGPNYDALIEAIESVLIDDVNGRTQIGVNLHEFGGITDENSFYINILDQNGNVMTKITPTQKTIDNYVTEGKIIAITACAVIGAGDSSSWDNSPAIEPTADKVPTKAVLYVNGVEKGSTTDIVYGGSFSSWVDVVNSYNASVNP